MRVLWQRCRGHPDAPGVGTESLFGALYGTKSSLASGLRPGSYLPTSLRMGSLALPYVLGHVEVGQTPARATYAELPEGEVAVAGDEEHLSLRTGSRNCPGRPSTRTLPLYTHVICTVTVSICVVCIFSL